MLYHLDDFKPRANFSLRLKKDGKLVPGSLREVHNVFTNTGRSWLSRLVAWQSLGTPDVAYTNRRVRWVSVGTGTTYTEQVTVERLETPAKVNATDYLAPIQETQKDPDGLTKAIRFIRQFGSGEVSIDSNPVVAVTEAGLFVDVYPVSTIGGSEDSAAPSLDTVLDPTISTYAPVAYARFEPITKTADFTLELRWDFRF